MSKQNERATFPIALLIGVLRLLIIGVVAACKALAFSVEADHFVYENKVEFITTGDFDGDGRQDVVIVNRHSGNCRMGYQLKPGALTWSTFHPSEVPHVTSISVGKILDLHKDALAVASADANGIAVLDASNSSEFGNIRKIVPHRLGPNTVVAMGIGSKASKLFIGSIFSEKPVAELYALADGKFVAEFPLRGPISHAQRLTLKPGEPELLCTLVPDTDKDRFTAQSLVNGKLHTVLQIDDLPVGADFCSGNFPGQPFKQLLFYRPETAELLLYEIEEKDGKIQCTNSRAFAFPQPFSQLLVVGKHLLALDKVNQLATVYSFDGSSAPLLVQTLPARSGMVINGAFVLGDQFGLLSSLLDRKPKPSTQVDLFHWSERQFVSADPERLPPLLPPLENKYLSIIYQDIVDNAKRNPPSEMKLYTNTIPGTPVPYTMVPIPGGEFVMGSPEKEKGRSPDEGPQKRVKVAPLWMGRSEVTWNEFEAFLYGEDRRNLMDDPSSDLRQIEIAAFFGFKGSKPYIEFEMGKDGFPANRMTHYAATRYCIWLSAKTGHFYRLPTEAEWEYACRAGTTTPYSFGEDASKLGDYAWFEGNSDYKYHKVGTRKANSWGLFDMHGNVAEWCWDEFVPQYAYQIDGLASISAMKPFPHAVRGGSWDHPAPYCRSAARMASTPAWNLQVTYPTPYSWYLSDAHFVGFRLVRPLKVPPMAEMLKYLADGLN